MNFPEVLIKANNPKKDWIEKNLKKMMDQVMLDARYQRLLPLKIVMHPLAFQKFVEILKSKSAYFPNEKGLDFIGIPVYQNSKLPYGCFTIERFKN